MTAICLSFNDSDTQILEVGIVPFNFILYTLFFYLRYVSDGKLCLVLQKNPLQIILNLITMTN